MSLTQHGAPGGSDRRSIRRSARLALVTTLAAIFALGLLTTAPAGVAAASRKVVIVVGPAGASTAKYIASAKTLAAQARSYGAAVVEIYSPNATWSRVKSAAQGAKLFIYLGHGNGWPSPYGPYQPYTKDGIGLNATAGNGHYNVKYWGEYYVGRDINFARNAVVILNRLCYASGNSEWGSANPTKSVAIQRVDNYGVGFFRANAKAVFAEGVDNVGYIIHGLFKTNATMTNVFWSDPVATKVYSFGFNSKRFPGARALMDPMAPSRYYRSLIGSLFLTTATWRNS